MTSSDHGIWSGLWSPQECIGRTCRAAFSHQAEVMTGGTSKRMASVSGAVDLGVKRLAESTCLLIQELTAKIAWSDRSSAHLYMGHVKIAATNVTAGEIRQHASCLAPERPPPLILEVACLVASSSQPIARGAAMAKPFHSRKCRKHKLHTICIPRRLHASCI